MNPFLILGPLGSIIIGFLSIIIWKIRGNVEVRYFLLGGLVWGISIAPKIAMDFTLTPRLNSWAKDTFSITGLLIILGIYVGLRTGLLECGFAFLAFSRTRLRKATLEEATAFGVGFGAIEAILIGFPSLMQLLMFIVNPSILESLSPAQRKIIESSLNSPTWVTIAPVVERTFTLFAHIFASVLIYISVAQRKLNLLLIAILYKTALDSMVPYIQTMINIDMPITLLEAEVWVTIMGSIGLFGTFYLRKKHQEALRRNNYEGEILR